MKKNTQFDVSEFLYFTSIQVHCGQFMKLEKCNVVLRQCNLISIHI